MEDTSLLPNPIIISIRSKMAFQFIELKDRDDLVESLLIRLKQVHADHPVHYSTSQDDDMVRSFKRVGFHTLKTPPLFFLFFFLPVLWQWSAKGNAHNNNAHGYNKHMSDMMWPWYQFGTISDALGVLSRCSTG